MADSERASMFIFLLSSFFAILSTIILSFGLVLILIFQLHWLSFISLLFPIFVGLIFAIGGFGLFNSVLAIGSVMKQSTSGLKFNGFLQFLLALLQIAGFIVSFELRNFILNDTILETNLISLTNNYHDNVWIKNQIDILQTYYR